MDFLIVYRLMICQKYKQQLQTMENLNINQSLYSSSFCKNHPEISSGYFLADFPETQYCKNCALNAALCGRKIEKKLTQQQVQRKTQILNLTEQLITCNQQIKVSHQLYLKLEDYLHEVCIPLEMRIKQIDSIINEWCGLRDKMNQIYTKALQGEIQRCRKLRDDSSLNEIHINKVIEHIQCNFTSLIELEDPLEFEKESSEWKKILKENRESILDKHKFQEKMAVIKDNVSNFLVYYQKGSQIRIEKKQFILDEQIEGNNKENNQLWVDQINLQGSRLVQQLKLNLTANAHLKNRPKKQIADRDYSSFSKKTNRRQSSQISEAPERLPQSKKKSTLIRNS